MLEHILICNKCSLCCNQKPTLDIENSDAIFWVGLSAKKSSKMLGPLSSETNTGRIIQMIEKDIPNMVTYKTNLVKCPPLNERGKLRYPTNAEIQTCIKNLDDEIKSLTPKIVFLLGEKVSLAVANYYQEHFEKWRGYKYYYTDIGGCYFIPIQHPSYIYIYKKRDVQEYISGIRDVIRRVLEVQKNSDEEGKYEFE